MGSNFYGDGNTDYVLGNVEARDPLGELILIDSEPSDPSSEPVILPLADVNVITIEQNQKWRYSGKQSNWTRFINDAGHANRKNLSYTTPTSNALVKVLCQRGYRC